MREEFKIGPAKWPDFGQVVETILSGAGEAKGAPQAQLLSVSQTIAKAVAAIATNAWKAQLKMLEPDTQEPKQEYKQVYRQIQGVLEGLKDMGVEIQDHTDKPFDYGLPLKVVTSQPTQGLTKERITETFKPTVYWQGQIIQMGEVVIATPA